jgi:hypothetical protein
LRLILICKACGAEKPHDAYYAKDKTCKDCRKARVRANRLEKLEQYTAYEKSRATNPERVAARRAYIQTDAGKASKRKTILRYRKDNPKKYAAHTALNNAVRDGVLTKIDNCVECDSDFAVEAHHDDYDFPLTVRWLCSLCHKRWHAEHGEALNGE